MFTVLEMVKVCGFKGDGGGKWNFGSNETPLCRLDAMSLIKYSILLGGFI